MTNIPSVTIPVEQSTIEALDLAIIAFERLDATQPSQTSPWRPIQELRALRQSLLVAQRRATARQSPAGCATCEE
jgi:hypothetical protein